jgi:hypothetical protein
MKKMKVVGLRANRGMMPRVIETQWRQILCLLMEWTTEKQSSGYLNINGGSQRAARHKERIPVGKRKRTSQARVLNQARGILSLCLAAR